MTVTTVACCQLAPRIGEVEQTRAAGLEAVTRAAAAGAQVVVLPELANSGYVFADADEARGLSEPVDGPTVQGWTASAARHGVVVVGGLCERGPGDTVFTSSVVVDRSGIRAVYRKAHLWDREKLVFTAGDERPPVVPTEYGRLATVVCYDLEFPEWVRHAGDAGAELICAPTNWPAYPRPAGERPAEIVRVQALASSQRLFVAACDRAGAERGVSWVSGSCVVAPDGYPLALADGQDRPQTVVARLDLAQARNTRISRHNDVRLDRRPKLY